MDLQYEVAIIGSGPAGMTAAVYASRAGAKTLIIEAGAPGGKMIKTHLVENYSGFSSVTGVDLALKMNEHSLAFGATYEYGNIIEVKPYEGGFELISEHGVSWKAKTVICATGTIEKKLGLDHEDDLVGRGVSYCAVCDGAFFKDKEVVVIGGGNSALDESLYLTQFVKKVTIVIRRDVFRAVETTVELVKNHPKIDIITHHIPVELLTENEVLSGVVIENTETKERQTIPASALFPYIGAQPATDYLKKLNILNDQGYVEADELMRTPVPGLFCAGDMIDKHLRQIVTATSDGAIAAQQALKYLKEH